MDKREAKEVIIGELAPYREKAYSELISMIEEVKAYEKVVPRGSIYQIEIQMMWDDSEGGNIRVWGNIDDGGIRALFPMVECFIMSPSGEFIDE